ncbi:MAG: N-acetylneuraminate synthase [Candidatus Omnitrophica bacterium]|nr:N-acetylneuraminate synthase [Candidatus Omnitrophota bacterium]
MVIGGRKVGEGQPCFIIAEAGVNHNGRLDLAKRLIDAAAQAGVDAVKFQTFDTEEVIIEGVAKAPYQKKTTAAGESQTAMLKRLEIDKAFHLRLIKYCRQKNIIFLSTCSGESSLNLLVELDLPVLKIASMDIANPMFLEKVAQKGKPVILSTGMSLLAEVEQAYQCLKGNGCKEMAILKCTSNYPTSPGEVHLRGLQALQERFNAVIGFSDHTQGLGASPYAVAMGAKIVEKHFTLDKGMEGPDHKASLSPDELTLWVKEIRRVEQMLGSKEIQPTQSEKETSKAMRRSLVPRVDLKKGDIITRKNIAAKRTGGAGISALEFYKVLGLEAACDVPRDKPIQWSYLEK